MKNQIQAFLDRGEIRDCFDIEFLLQRGIEFPSRFDSQRGESKKQLSGLKERDFTANGEIYDRAGWHAGHGTAGP